MYCECLHSWCGMDLHWQSLKTHNHKSWWQSLDSAQELRSHQNVCIYNFGTQAARWMPRVMTVRQFPPSESFSNRVIFESPQMLSFHLFPTCFLLRFLCFLCFFCLALCHSDLIFWSLVSHSRFLWPNELATNIVRVPLKSRKIQANF